jgi:hypothetical protein
MWPLNGLRFSATLSGQYVAAARKSDSATWGYSGRSNWRCAPDITWDSGYTGLRTKPPMAIR